MFVRMLDRTAIKIFASGVALFVALFVWYRWSLMDGLFFTIWWWDIPLHIAGGLYAGLIGAWWDFVLGEKHPIRAAIIGALVLGAWVEMTEYILGFTYSPWMSYPIDTAKDLFDDLIGGAIAGYLASKL